MKQPLFPLVLTLVACGSATRPPDPPGEGLQLNDVSFLYPLPASVGQASALLDFTSAGPQGALLPRALFDQVKKVDEVLDANAVYSQMRIISARVDPCFPGNKPTEPLVCRKQVRLVAQMVEADQGQVSTRDGTIHLFYDLSDADFETATAAVFELKGLAGTKTNGPLDVNPMMKSQGLDGAYATRLNQMILHACGEQTLTRVAFMVSAQTNDKWTFGAFIRKGAVLEADPIPRTTDKKEQNFEEHGTEANRNGELVPAAPNDDLTTLLSQTELQLTDELTLQSAVGSALKIENPEKETPMSIDCASCHVASRALSNARAVRGVDTSTYPEAWKPPAGYDLRRVDQVGNNPFAQRAFGYFKAQTALSQRTINESAAIAEALNQAHH